MIPENIKAILPHKSGVYIFKDSAGGVLYVGKAIDLYKRVASYFNNSSTSFKTSHLAAKIYDCEVVVVESEFEALILEANLIKKFLPPYNIRLTDDKDYIYIVLTREVYPRIITGRKQDLEGALKYFGPFPSSGIVKDTLKKLRRIFPWCASPSRREFPISNEKNFRPCFYYHLGLCPGACVGKISREEYGKIIKRFIKLMEGRKTELVEEIGKDMEKSAKDLNFEEAQMYKRIINGISYLTSPNRTAQYLSNPNFLDEERSMGLMDLMKVLDLKKMPERIECFDISNIQGDNASGSMVVLTNGEIDKSQYRKFKIKITGKPNDYEMHREMFLRRLKHLEWPYPDLILVDGGKGQVGVYAQELDKRNLSIPLFGLAKRMEWLYSISGGVTRLPRNSLGLRLLQKIRDEAHRFAISYHKKLRSRAMYG